MRRRAAAVLALALAVSVAGCGSDAGDDRVTITVYAAASLTEAFTEIGERYEEEHDGVAVRFSFGGSSDLVEQIVQGAPADVFASADEKNMTKLVGADLARDDPAIFASNALEIATPPDNPAGITSLADLAQEGVRLVVCAAEVPCGAAALRVAEAAGVRLEPVSEEQSVKDVLAKVTSGEADAGLVYVTDVRAAGDAVRGIPFPGAAQAPNLYPIASIEDGENEELAAEFVDFVLSDTGRAVLASYGFGPGLAPS